MINKQLYFDFYKSYIKYNDIKFIKFLSKNVDNKDRIIGFCYNTISNNLKIFNDLYTLRCRHIVKFNVTIDNLKKYNLKIYFEKNNQNLKDKILKLYQYYLNKNGIKYYFDNISRFIIQYNQLEYFSYLQLEGDKCGYIIHNFLNLDNQFYIDLLDLIDIFNIELNYTEVKNLKVNKIDYFKHNRRLKYLKRDTINNLIEA